MPAKEITVGKLVQLLEESDERVLDVPRMADALDVSQQAIRNYRDDLEEREEVAHMKIGRTTVYWYVGPSEKKSPLTGEEMQDAIDEYGTPMPEIPLDDGDPPMSPLPPSPPTSDAAVADGGHTPVEQTFTSLTVYSGLAVLAVVLIKLVNMMLGGVVSFFPYGPLGWWGIIAGSAVFTASYLTLRAERELKSNRVATAFRAALTGGGE